MTIATVYDGYLLRTCTYWLSTIYALHRICPVALISLPTCQPCSNVQYRGRDEYIRCLVSTMYASLLIRVEQVGGDRNEDKL